jgi:hypothetical protein
MSIKKVIFYFLLFFFFKDYFQGQEKNLVNVSKLPKLENSRLIA